MVGAAERVDRLIVIADDADIAAPLRERSHHAVLRLVDILVFVDEDVAEALSPGRALLAVAFDERQRPHDEVVEIERIRDRQSPLIFRVHRANCGSQATIGRARIRRGRKTSFLRAADLVEQRPGSEVALVEVEIAEDLPDELALVRFIVDDEIRRDADDGTIAAQYSDAYGVEGADPEALRYRPDERMEALLQFAGRFVRERDGDDAIGGRSFFCQQMGDAMRQDARLAAPGARENKNGALGVGGRCALFFVERVEWIHQARTRCSPFPMTLPAGTLAPASTTTSSPSIASRTVAFSSTKHPGHKMLPTIVAPSAILTSS